MQRLFSHFLTADWARKSLVLWASKASEITCCWILFFSFVLGRGDGDGKPDLAMASSVQCFLLFVVAHTVPGEVRGETLEEREEMYREALRNQTFALAFLISRTQQASPKRLKDSRRNEKGGKKRKKRKKNKLWSGRRCSWTPNPSQAPPPRQKKGRKKKKKLRHAFLQDFSVFCRTFVSILLFLVGETVG